MHPKILKMTKLIEAGYAMDEIRSDTEEIHARFTSVPGERVLLTFDRDDAESLLYDVDAFDAPESRRHRSRWLVKQTLG